MGGAALQRCDPSLVFNGGFSRRTLPCCNIEEMHPRAILVLSIAATSLLTPLIPTAQAQSTPAASSSAHHPHKPAPAAENHLDPGSVTNGIYRNPSFGFTCKIPSAWVLRTDEMNTKEDAPIPASGKDSNASARVLLSAFSRPPQARAEDVNSSILIAAETAATYPGLKDAAQYFEPVSEIAKAQGFDLLSGPYEFPLGTKSLVRADFQKDVGTRVMLQSTMVLLSRGYLVSFTFIAGTEDELEDLIANLSFGAPAKTNPR
jgi:hypothetical protein